MLGQGDEAGGRLLPAPSAQERGNHDYPKVQQHKESAFAFNKFSSGEKAEEKEK